MEIKSYLSQFDTRLHEAKLLIKKSNFSNFNEEQILRKYVDQLLPAGDSRVAVDIGAGDGVKGSNTYALFSGGWKGLGVECVARRAEKLAKTYSRLEGVTACRSRVAPEGVVPLLREHGVRRGFAVLSLDIDSYDYPVLDALLANFRPRIVVTEINEKIPPPLRFFVKYDPDFRLRHHFYGYSIASLADLCEKHGYTILELEYNNAFLAPREICGEPRQTAEEIYRRGYLERPDRRKKFPSNHDMDALLSMSPAKALAFIDHFFAKHRGKYELSLGS